MGRKRKSKGKRKKLHVKSIDREAIDSTSTPVLTPSAEDSMFEAAPPMVEPEPAAVEIEPTEERALSAPISEPVMEQEVMRPKGLGISEKSPQQAQEGEYQKLDYARAWRRLGATLYDLTFAATFAAVWLSVMTIKSLARFAEPLTDNADPLLPLLELKRAFSVGGVWLFVLLWLYFTLPECTRRGATLGKLIFRIKVTDEFGRRMTFGKSNLRFVSKLASIATLGVGFAMMLFNKRHQALHDRLSKTVVLHTKKAAVPAEPTQQLFFTTS